VEDSKTSSRRSVNSRQSHHASHICWEVHNVPCFFISHLQAIRFCVYFFLNVNTTIPHTATVKWNTSCIFYVGGEVTKKWKNLRMRFRDEKTKMKASKSGMRGDDTYESKWRWFGMMKFMDEHVGMKPKRTLSNFDPPGQFLYSFPESLARTVVLYYSAMNACCLCA